MLFAWKVCKHVRSNAIVLSNDLASVGIGAGQMSRVDSVRLAIDKARAAGSSLLGAALASDAFFPFADGPQLAVDAGRHDDHPAGRLGARPRGRRGRRRRGDQHGADPPPPLQALAGLTAPGGRRPPARAENAKTASAGGRRACHRQPARGTSVGSRCWRVAAHRDLRTRRRGLAASATRSPARPVSRSLGRALGTRIARGRAFPRRACRPASVARMEARTIAKQIAYGRIAVGAALMVTPNTVTDRWIGPVADVAGRTGAERRVRGARLRGRRRHGLRAAHAARGAPLAAGGRLHRRGRRRGDVRRPPRAALTRARRAPWRSPRRARAIGLWTARRLA